MTTKKKTTRTKKPTVGFEVVNDKHRRFPDVDIRIPTIADIGSACADFYTPCDIYIEAGKIAKVWTDIKAYMPKDVSADGYVRSSVGIKKGVVLANGTAIIDSSYYGNEDNDGNICFALWNASDSPVEFKKGDRITQIKFVKNVIPVGAIVLDGERTGGIGSTGK